MRLAIIVTEYPKTTETFILRDIMTFLDQGVEVKLFHLSSYNTHEILHDFAEPTRALAQHPSMLGGAAWKTIIKNPGVLASCAATIIKRQAPEPVLMAKSLALISSASAIADEIRDWGADHVHGEFAGHPATVAWIIHRLLGIPYSVSCRAHDIFRTQRLLAEKLGEAAFVRTVSKYAKNFLLERVPGLDSDRMHVIHSSVATDVIPKLEPAEADPFHILYVGSLQIRKGVPFLLEALKTLPFSDWKCTIAGDGPDRQKLEEQTRALGLGEHVAFIGKQDFNAVSALYAAASVVAVPSIIGPKGRTEGIPNVAIEGLAFQRPVISTNVSGIPELVRNNETGWLIEPGSVTELVAAITDIKDHPTEAHARAVAGRKHVETEFALSTNALRQLELFRAHSAHSLLEAAQ